MTISYNWISEYIPSKYNPEQISKILTSIGLEVESLERFESIKGGLEGLIVGEVKECVQHPAADKLKLTKVDTSNGQLLQIVCGAPNVKVGQKVVVAPIGSTIYPVNGDPVTMKKAKIRGEESFGMICAEDEIGTGEQHDGIIILPEDLKAGTRLAEYYHPYSDWIYEIGLTPNRMDAMSHLGVARDICAYLAHHEKKDVTISYPLLKNLQLSDNSLPFKVFIENNNGCQRYAGISIRGIEVKPSPAWLQNKLKAIGQRPINNIVDITNYILHDTGQPLHAFDADKVAGNTIIVKNLPEGTVFKTLDDKEKKLSREDLMICDGSQNGLCIAGVFGGAASGVKPETKNIFLESAWFNPIDIRKTSFRHGLRTEAAARFEKNVDISNTAEVLKRAAMMIVEIAGGVIACEPIDVYPSPKQKTKVELSFPYLKKLSGKIYDHETVKNILTNLGFESNNTDGNTIVLTVPYSKPDVTLQADIVEEIMRIDGYDNIEIPKSITITPSSGALDSTEIRKEKIAGYLVGTGFSEIFTNSITNAAYFESSALESAVRMLNNLSAVHNIMRPSMLETGLESVAYNLNRKNNDLRFFEFGKSYKQDNGTFEETEHLCLYVTGKHTDASWKGKSQPIDIFYLKGIVESVLRQAGLTQPDWQITTLSKLSAALTVTSGKKLLVEAGTISKQELNRFDIRQDVYYADIRWKELQYLTSDLQIKYSPLANQLPVYRDLAMVVPKTLSYQSIQSAIKKLKTGKLRDVRLFDVFESEKLGSGKKSMALSFTFLDDEKTLTDKEIDSMMNKIMLTLEQDLNAEIRKGS